jgi:hypothetical protein
MRPCGVAPCGRVRATGRGRSRDGSAARARAGRARATGRGRGGGGALHLAAARGRGGEEALLPEENEVLQAGEQAGEHGQDQGVQRRDQPGTGGFLCGHRTHVGGHAGDKGGQGGVGIR